MKHSRLPTLFISHGGGPWPWVDDMANAFARTAAELKALPGKLPYRPEAVLAISGHWARSDFTLGTARHPPTEYDYTGFPEHTYQIRYPAPGAPELGARVRPLLEAAGIACAEDVDRGFDHGVFVPLYLMYPDADMPVLMLSMKADYDPAQHLRVGAALEPLREEGILIMGSGLTYHNLSRFGPQGAEVSAQFEAWLHDAISRPRMHRDKLLTDWLQGPGARLAHPREDHLVPLMVVAGAAGDSRGERLFVDRVWGITMASYSFVDR